VIGSKRLGPYNVPALSIRLTRDCWN